MIIITGYLNLVNCIEGLFVEWEAYVCVCIAFDTEKVVATSKNQWNNFAKDTQGRKTYNKRTLNRWHVNKPKVKNFSTCRFEAVSHERINTNDS